MKRQNSELQVKELSGKNNGWMKGLMKELQRYIQRKYRENNRNDKKVQKGKCVRNGPAGQPSKNSINDW